MTEPARELENFDPVNRELPFLTSMFTTFICILFGINAVAIKYGMIGFGPFTGGAIRFVIAAVTIYLWAHLTGRPLRIKRDQYVPMLVICIIFSIQISFFYIGISKTLASRCTLIINLLPFFILILAHFFIPGDRITAKKAFGILLGFGGIIFVFADKHSVGGSVHAGDLLVLCASILWAVNTIYIKKIINDFEPHQLVIYQMIFAAPVVFTEAVFFDGFMINHPDLKVVSAILYQSFVTASFGFIAWSSLMKRYGATALHSFVFIIPISGVIFGNVILDEPITHKMLIALILIVIGIIIVQTDVAKFKAILRFR